MVHLDPGKGWWTAAVHAVSRAAGDSTGRELDAIDITVVGSPEDHAVGSDNTQLERFVATVWRLAAKHGTEHGLEIEDVTKQQRKTWRSGDIAAEPGQP